MGYEPSELPDCSTPQHDGSNARRLRQPEGPAARRQVVRSVVDSQPILPNPPIAYKVGVDPPLADPNSSRASIRFLFALLHVWAGLQGRAHRSVRFWTGLGPPWASPPNTASEPDRNPRPG